MNRYPNADIGPIVSAVMDCASENYDANTRDIARVIAAWEGMNRFEAILFADRCFAADREDV